MKIFNSTSLKVKRGHLRHNMPIAEVLLWQRIKGRQLDNLKFRRQTSIGKYVVDFYCPSNKLIIELDGDSHYLSERNRMYDKDRDNYLKRMGCKIFRFKNSDVYNNMEGLLGTVRNARTTPAPPWKGGE